MLGWVLISSVADEDEDDEEDEPGGDEDEEAEEKSKSKSVKSPSKGAPKTPSKAHPPKSASKASAAADNADAESAAADSSKEHKGKDKDSKTSAPAAEEEGWVVIQEYSNDLSLQTKGQAHIWELDPTDSFYSKFRIKMTGKNSNNQWFLALSGFEGGAFSLTAD